MSGVRGEWDFGTFRRASEQHRDAADDLRAALGLPPIDREAEDDAHLEMMFAEVGRLAEEALATVDELAATLDEEHDL